MGKTCLRAVIDHPDLELVGLYVYNPEKTGKDAGEIARRDPTGVIATRDMEEILALDADVVIHAPRIQFPYSFHNEDICRLLASGKNLISINGHTFPQYHGAAYADKLELACLRGNSSLFGTGLNPGFVVEKITAAATGLCTELESVFIEEVFDVVDVPDSDYLFNVCGIGSNPRQMDITGSGPIAELISGIYSEVIGLLVHRLGMSLERIEPEHRVTLAPQDIKARAGTVAEGTVAATNWCWHGIVEGRRFMTLSVNWIIGRSLPGFEEYDQWKILIRGKPGINITMNFSETYPGKERTKPEQYGVAGSVINAIPEVCAAPPGIFHIPVFASYRKRF